jgi:hypothetical protein
MRLGLDLDNTLIYYDQLFVDVARRQGLVPISWRSSKSELKEYLLKEEDGDRRWMALQGMVYGKAQAQAQIFKGVPLFLMRARFHRVAIWIVSHKTQYGHFDSEKIPLRQVAMEWMEQHGFFATNGFAIDPTHVYFAPTREEKVCRIGELALTHFVDDLPEVFAERSFPQMTQPLLLDPRDDRTESADAYSSWQAIAMELFGEIGQEEIEWITRTAFSEPIIDGRPIAKSGNSLLFRLDLEDGRRAVLKCYPDLQSDPRDRLGTEFAACRFLAQNGLGLAPDAICKSAELNIGMYEWVEGDLVEQPRRAEIETACTFVRQLWQMRHCEGADEFGEASEACLCPGSIEQQVNRRLQKLEVAKGLFPELREFLDGPLAGLYAQVLDFTKPYRQGGFYDTPLPKEQQTLSPSDFGFHNALARPDGSLCFLDLEYFGWDDPVKLICDFLWHPGMDLSYELKEQWVAGCIDIFDEDVDLLRRIEVSWPLYGLRWIMIVLNEFHKQGWQRRVHARPDSAGDRALIRARQLTKAESLLMYLNDNLGSFPYGR